MELPFINREQSWLSFNERVLAEAANPANLPLDKLKFLAISASNLDEFIMVRIAYLNDKRGDPTPDDAGMTPQVQMEQALERVRAFRLKQLECLDAIMAELREREFYFLKPGELSDNQVAFAGSYFEDEILPVITPLAIDPARPFPLLGNLSLNIGVRMRANTSAPVKTNTGGTKNVYGIIQVPSILPRFIALPSGTGAEGRCFLALEDLIAHYLPDIFNLYEIRAWGLFRLTRSADFDADDDTDDLLEEMKRTIKKRKRGRPVGLELMSGFDEKMKDFLQDQLGVSKRFVSVLPGGVFDISAFMRISALRGGDHLRPAPINPRYADDFAGCTDIFAHIRKRDRMIHLPYESFDHVVAFIKSAATDANVLAIKQTLYRTSGQGEIVEALEQAAEAGKQVTVLVELKARFDEENNIQWAMRLERAGCHVIYGLTGLKTHCKICLVIRREEGGIMRYLHMSSGNYNDATARVYTDIGMFTCRSAFGADASALFNHLTGFSQPPNYLKLVVAPEHLKNFLLGSIDREIEHAQNGRKSGISIKVNSLLDSDIVRALYAASQAGVTVRLLVRGICSLVPGVSGVSDNIKVRSIVGRFLEHSRIFVFENAGNPMIHIGSADLMPRNLERRVETIFPVEEEEIKDRLIKLFELMWGDGTNAWELGSDTVYRRVENAGADTPCNSQAVLESGAVL